MITQQGMQHLEITLPDALYQWLSQEAQRRNQNASAVVQTALEYYTQHFDLLETDTWQLCGAFSIAEPEAIYLAGQGETEEPATNYAEHVDSVLYKGG